MLLEMCRCEVVDVLEAATSALANLTCYCDLNCKRLMEAGGVKVIVHVLGQIYTGTHSHIVLVVSCTSFFFFCYVLLCCDCELCSQVDAEHDTSTPLSLLHLLFDILDKL